MNKEPVAIAQRAAQRQIIDYIKGAVYGPGRKGNPPSEIPGTSIYVPNEDGTEHELLMVTRDEVAAWLEEMKPGLMGIGLDEAQKDRTFEDRDWIASCDEHGEVARGPATAHDHNQVVRAAYKHLEEHHGDDGQIPYGALITDRDGNEL